MLGVRQVLSARGSAMVAKIGTGFQSLDLLKNVEFCNSICMNLF